MKTRRNTYIAILATSFLLMGGCGPSRDGTITRQAEPVPDSIDPNKQYRAEPTKGSHDNRSVGEAKKEMVPARPQLRNKLSNDQEYTPHNTETYDRIYENEFLAAKNNPLSTFSTDVDTASYSLVRRFLNRGQLPPPGAVRVEELVNYFDYKYEPPQDGKPFAVHTELSHTPWNPQHLLLKIGIKGKVLPIAEHGPRNLVFLLDVSGSMNAPDKLPLLKQAMKLLSAQMTAKDRVSIVVYAGASGLVLKPTAGDDRNTIMDALDRLAAGGSTNGGAGIALAYKMARQSFHKDGVNRVILATDGDFNVGATNQSELIRMIERERESGVFLTVLGFGSGNYKDSTMEKLADKGNGNYAYIDNISEARKVLVLQIGGTLVTIAKDVKLQIEFNPARVQSYRLIGYENRMLRAEDFNDDKKDAGEIGAGHSVTALYEIVPVGIDSKLGGSVDALRYQNELTTNVEAKSSELALVKIRYKEPQVSASKLLSMVVQQNAIPMKNSTSDMKMASAVAAYGMLLRNSEHKGTADFAMVQELAKGAVDRDPHGYRAEFVRLAQMASDMQQ